MYRDESVLKTIAANPGLGSRIKFTEFVTGGLVRALPPIVIVLAARVSSMPVDGEKHWVLAGHEAVQVAGRVAAPVICAP